MSFAWAEQQGIYPRPQAESNQTNTMPTQAKRRPPVPVNNDHRIVSMDQAAQFCGVSTMTWLRLQRLGQTPPVIHLSKRRVGYMLSDVINWLEQRKELRAAQ
jgi:predicted DNA-binding transcriptional regulator AlpA